MGLTVDTGGLPGKDPLSESTTDVVARAPPALTSPSGLTVVEGGGGLPASLSEGGSAAEAAAAFADDIACSSPAVDAPSATSLLSATVAVAPAANEDGTLTSVADDSTVGDAGTVSSAVSAVVGAAAEDTAGGDDVSPAGGASTAGSVLLTAAEDGMVVGATVFDTPLLAACVLTAGCSAVAVESTDTASASGSLTLAAAGALMTNGSSGVPGGVTDPVSGLVPCAASTAGSVVAAVGGDCWGSSRRDTGDVSASAAVTESDAATGGVVDISRSGLPPPLVSAASAAAAAAARPVARAVGVVPLPASAAAPFPGGGRTEEATRDSPTLPDDAAACGAGGDVCSWVDPTGAAPAASAAASPEAVGPGTTPPPPSASPTDSRCGGGSTGDNSAAIAAADVAARTAAAAEPEEPSGCTGSTPFLPPPPFPFARRRARPALPDLAMATGTTGRPTTTRRGRALPPSPAGWRPPRSGRAEGPHRGVTRRGRGAPRPLPVNATMADARLKNGGQRGGDKEGRGKERGGERKGEIESRGERRGCGNEEALKDPGGRKRGRGGGRESKRWGGGEGGNQGRRRGALHQRPCRRQPPRRRWRDGGCSNGVTGGAARFARAQNGHAGRARAKLARGTGSQRAARIDTHQRAVHQTSPFDLWRRFGAPFEDISAFAVDVARPG